MAHSTWMKKLRLDQSLNERETSWSSPEGFSPVDRDRFQRNSLAKGASAPDFALPKLGGGTLSLTESLGNAKALLVNFWFGACGPCRAEIPHLQKLYERLEPRGLKVIAVNAFDDEAETQRFVRENALTFPVALGGANEKLIKPYGVEVFPTTFLLGPDGKVLWRGIGYREFNDSELMGALKKLGLE